MRILLIDLDSKIPNLALMKISSYHKSKGDDVYLNKGCNPDKVYVSCIFKKNKSQAIGLSKMFECKVSIGGYGVNNNKLPLEIENKKPDYSLYNVDYSIGYTSRGCIRKCKFCIIPDNEGNIKNKTDPRKIIDPKHKKLILLDNNFLASPKWKENLKYLIENKIKVCFMQGLDIRLINEENAKLLSKLKFRNKKFSHPCLYFAFDSINYEKQVLNGINILVENGIKPYKLMFYILTNFDTKFIEDYYRFELLRNLGTDPFIMLYGGGNQLLNKFSRYVNKRIYKVCEFWEYDRLTLKEKIFVKKEIEKLRKYGLQNG
jgi:hypothetical protein